MAYSVEKVKKAVLSKGYTWFDGNKDYDLNIVGIRKITSGKKVTNIFDDWLTLSYKKDGEWQYHEWRISTDPGRKHVLNFSNPKGVAILKAGQYKGSHMIGLHRGKYEALRQKGKVTVWRDNNKDLTFDEVTEDTGYFGINIHRSNATTESEYVESWSAGCQVFKRVKDFNEFMSICREARKVFGNSFTYTLLESTDFGSPEPIVKKTEPQSKEIVYTIKRGDSLSKIARKYGTTVTKLKARNDLQSDLIIIGRKLIIPKN